MTIEREYYENDGFWNDASVRSTDLARVQLLAELIPDGVEAILEVGCGNGIFVNALEDGNRRYSRVVGIDRSIAALRYVRTRKLCASVDQLPFRDRDFDFVAALEVIEHLPVKTYRAALEETCRLARRFVLVSVPCEQDLRAALIECPACATRFNPDYHMRSFDDATVRTLLDPYSFRCVRLMNLGTYSRYRGVDKLKSIVRDHDTTGNPFSVEIPCPVCGFQLPAAPAVAGASKAAARRSGPLKLVKSLWPKADGHTWIAALFERVDEL